MSKILTNTLAQDFSFQGRGNKHKFQALKVWDLIQGIFLNKFIIFIFTLIMVLSKGMHFS